jgi:tetratricopeptide (TPR) repeat protein
MILPALKTLPVLLLLIIPGVSVHAGSYFDLNENLKQAYSDLFLLKLQSAEQLARNERIAAPENAASYFIQNYSDFLAAFITEESPRFEQFKSGTESRIRKIEQLPNTTPWKGLAKGEMLLQLGVLKLKNSEFISAGYYLRKSYHILSDNQKKFPKFMPGKKALGFFHAAIGTVPQNYKWLANLAGMTGTIDQGSEELKSYFKWCNSDKQYAHFADEAVFLNILVALHFEKDLMRAKLLLLEFDPNVSGLHTFITSTVYIANEQYQMALNMIQDYVEPAGQFPLSYLHYLQGQLLLTKIDHRAGKYFQLYTSNHRGHTFIKSAWQKKGWLELMKGDTGAYKRNMDMVRRFGNEFTDEDKAAMREAVAGQIPNAILLKARLLFDGGEYHRAMAELSLADSDAFGTLKDKVEYTYRMARIFDKKGQHDQAIQFYNSTYKIGKDHPWYFAANAALMLGNLYEEKNDCASASSWYKKCLMLRNHEYQNSIDQKAEAGMMRCGGRN